MSRERPIQNGGQFDGQPYKLPQSKYAQRYGVTLITINRWWKRRLPCDDPDAMGEFLSNAGRKPEAGAMSVEGTCAIGAGDKLAESRLARLDEKFLEGEGLVAAITRNNKIELALAAAIRDTLNEPAPDVRKLLNRLAARTAVVDSMRKLEKDTPGILEQHKKQIDIGEVEEGVTRLLLAVTGRLQNLPVRVMQTLAGFTDPQEVREELEKEITASLAPFHDCGWWPEQYRSLIPADESSSPTATTPPAADQSKPQRQAKPARKPRLKK